MRRCFIWVGLCLAAGCGRGLEQEPNDHFTQATAVGATTRMEGTLRTADDVDIYKIESAQGGKTLSLHLGGIREVDFVISILDSDRRELKRFDETALGGDERVFDIALKKGDTYIVISNKNPEARNKDQKYALELRFSSAEGREREPNDRALEATPLPLGGIMRGHYFPSRNLLAEENGFLEEDWYRIDVHQDGKYLLNVDVSEVPSVDSVLEVYGPNSYKIKEIDAGGPGEPEVLRGFGLRGPVHYYLRLRSKSKHSANSEIPYQILTELIPYRGVREFESNDQRLEATEFSREEILGTIAPKGDVDWYEIIVDDEEMKIFSARLGGVEGLDLTLKVTDDLGRTLLEIDDAGKEKPEVLTGLGLIRGKYYLVVGEKTGKRSDARRDYRLSRTLEDFTSGLEFELNDSSGTAQSLEVGGSVDGYIAPKGDRDWYVINVYQAAGFLLEATGVLNVRLRLELFDQEGISVAMADGLRPGEAVTIDHALLPGPYSVRLWAEGAAQNNVRDTYTFRIRAR